MKNLIIKNDGLITVEDLMLIGSSTKRSDSDKIGMFGSGWKYALAYLLRNDVNIDIYSGLDVIKISTVEKYHRNNKIKVITVNDIETSLTTEMGPQWTAWMAIREIVSNAIDEGGYSYKITRKYSERFMSDSTTTICLSLNDELQNIMDNFDDYFSFDKTPDFTYSYGKIFLKQELSPLVIYRKGIKCYNTEFLSYFDIDFNDIKINESRLTDTYSINGQFKKLLELDDINEDVLFAIFKTQWEKYSINPFASVDTPSEHILTHATNIKEKYNASFTCEMISKLGGLLFSDTGDILLHIPDTWYKDFRDAKLITTNILSFGSFEFIKNDNLSTEMYELIDNIKTTFDKYNLSFGVEIGELTYGRIQFYNNTIFIKEDYIDKITFLELCVDILDKLDTNKKLTLFS